MDGKGAGGVHSPGRSAATLPLRPHGGVESLAAGVRRPGVRVGGSMASHGNVLLLRVITHPLVAVNCDSPSARGTTKPLSKAKCGCLAGSGGGGGRSTIHTHHATPHLLSLRRRALTLPPAAQWILKYYNLIDFEWMTCRAECAAYTFPYRQVFILCKFLSFLDFDFWHASASENLTNCHPMQLIALCISIQLFVFTWSHPM